MKLNGPYPLPNVAWRKNRNAFAALLARAVEEVDFREPFDRRPPGAPMSNQNHPPVTYALESTEEPLTEPLAPRKTDGSRGEPPYLGPPLASAYSRPESLSANRAWLLGAATILAGH